MIDAKNYVNVIASLNKGQLIAYNDCLITCGYRLVDGRNLSIEPAEPVSDGFCTRIILDNRQMHVLEAMLAYYKFWSKDDVRALALLLLEHKIILQHARSIGTVWDTVI